MSEREYQDTEDKLYGESTKGTRWMPKHQMAKKDVANCEKPRRAVSEHRPGDIRMGKPGRLETCHSARKANGVN